MGADGGAGAAAGGGGRRPRRERDAFEGVGGMVGTVKLLAGGQAERGHQSARRASDSGQGGRGGAL
jgi:hypothetical protein